jgi:hypothetical protein
MSKDTDTNNAMTTVKTIYARAAVILLALNFCLTGYVVVQMNNTVQEQLDTKAGSQETSMLSAESDNRATAPTLGQ